MSPNRTHRWRAAIAALVTSVLGIALVTATGGTPAQAQAPAASHEFVYVSGAAGQQQLFLHHANGRISQLTSDAAHEAQNGALSSDGSFAVFAKSATHLDGGDENLYVVDTTTKAVHELTNLSGQEIYPAISPDGKKVAFLHTDAAGPTTVGIYVVNVDGTGVQRLTPAEDGPNGAPTSGPVWSHNGAKLAVPVTLPTGDAVKTLNADGTGYQVVIPPSPGRFIGATTWTPDDRYLIYPATSARQFQATELATGTTTALTSNAGFAYGEPSITNDWTLYYTAAPTSGADTTSHIHQTWLGDLATDKAVINAPSGEWAPGVQQSGPAAPVPPNFPPGSGSTITTTPTTTTAPPTTSTTTPPPPGYRCGTVKFFGLRGSGQKAWEGEGLGSTIDAVKNSMAKQIPGLRFEAIDYPAIEVQWWDPMGYPSNYDVSLRQGKEELLKVFREFIHFCPKVYAVFAGYSQGAQAAWEAYSALSDWERLHVAALLQFGNPVFNPDKSQSVVNEGDYDHRLAGILLQTGHEPEVVTGKWKTFVRSWCSEKDPVCGYNKRNLARCNPVTIDLTCAHLRYVEKGYTKEAAQWAADHWRRLPALR